MIPELDLSLDWTARFVTDIPAAVALFDRERRYIAASAEWIALFGLSSETLLGRRHGEVSDTAGSALEQVQQRGLAGETIEKVPIEPDAANRLPAGMFNARPYSNPDGAIEGVIVGAHAAGQAAAALAHEGSGLAERHEFTRHLREVLAAPTPAGPGGDRRDIVVFVINLDGFRSVNNLHGVAIGDRVLDVTAERLVSGTRSRLSEGSTTRGRDMVARLGADEFGIICGAPALPLAEAQALAARLLRVVQSPIAIGAISLRLTASVGFVIPTGDHRREDDILRDLDLALRQAKTLGPSKVVAWEQALTTAATLRYSLAEQLRRAFDNGEFILHYQPVLRLSDNRMVGAEALLRWNHPSEGLATSAAFVPVLEDTGLIVEVGNWVIRETVRQVESWRVLYGRDIVDWVSVNISGRQFNDPGPLLTTLRAIHGGGFSVHRLKLEITETAIMRDPEITRSVLAELRDLGIRVAIDDFGTGYSSLNSLRHYPIDTIKIDGEFVAQIGTAEGEKLAQALLDIARMFGATIIAEGIETEAQRSFLRGGGCGFGQGYLFAEPMDGALLGAYALTHAVNADPRAASPRAASGAGTVSGPVNPATSAGPLRAR
jgi:diguanylate cyclase (GGDEF)-like protein